MELKDQVQGVVIGLFGAYAGGYFADLTSQAETGNPVALVEGLVNLQTPLLGVNLSDDAAWVDTILGHLGVSSTSAAYTAAAAWANGELDAGASRAEVVLAAVTYLLGDSVEAQYASVATAFKADVAAGVVYSEGEGAEVLAIGDLREAAGNPATGTSFNLTAALAEISAANAALEAFLKGAGLDIDLDGKTDDTTEADIGTNLDNAITAIEAAGVAAAYEKDGDAAVNASLVTLAKAELAADLTAKKKVLTDLQKYFATNADLAQAITVYTNATAAETAATKTAAAAALSLSEAAAVFELREETPTVDSDYDLVDGLLDPTTGGVTVVTDLGGGDNKLILWDATAKAFVVNSLVKTAAVGKAADSAEAKFLAEANTLLAAFQADYNAQKALNAAGTAQNASETALGAFDAAVGAFDADDVPPETGLALGQAIATATTDIADAEKAITTLNDALADLDGALALVAELKALKADITAAEKVVTDAGYAVLDLTDGAFTGKNDVLVVGEIDKTTLDATFSSFDLQGTDLIFIGAGYTFNSGDVKTAGNNAALEVFLTEDALGNAQIVLEEVAFGSNAVTPEVVTITLTGVNVADLTVANGYVQMA